jgi:NTP pyrophosphatase (non-canonical NTP hydrolase)
LKTESVSELRAEIARARAKFPNNRNLLAALMEEAGELARALLQEGNSEHAAQEALQTACVAMRIYEEGDLAYRDLSEEERQP